MTKIFERLGKAFVILLLKYSQGSKKINEESYTKINWKEDTGFIVKGSVF